MKKINTKGFTLVELLAVIMVLAIIMGIAIQSTQRIIKNNRRDSFVSSVDMVVESASLACLQGNGSFADVKTYIKGYDTTTDANDSNNEKGNGNITVTANNAAGTITIRAKANGQYKNLSYSDVSSKLGKYDGLTNMAAAASTTPTTVRINYECETE